MLESGDWKILTSTGGLSSFALGRNQGVICQWFNTGYCEKLSNTYDIAIVVVYKVSVPCQLNIYIMTGLLL